MRGEFKKKSWLFFAVFLVAVAGLLIFSFRPSFTGYVTGPNGEQCNGNWTCGEWGACVGGTQGRSCESADSTICTSPITESQSCTVACVENWTCADWTACADGNQTRTCTDSAACGTTTSKPIESQSCTVACVENWTCVDWSTCVDSSQTRTCTDSAACGTTTSKPIESQSCTVPSTVTTQTTIPTKYCGDGTCNTNENCSSCVKDCGTCIEENATPQEEIHVCIPDWQCRQWGECANGQQTRECTDPNKCNTEEGKPATSQACEMPIVITETCSDGIKNQDEAGVDCGGVCERRCSFTSMVGSAVTGSFDTGKQFVMEKIFANKTLTYALAGTAAALIAGIVALKVFLKKKRKN